MHKQARFIMLLLLMVLTPLFQATGQQTEKRALELKDILAWKTIQSEKLSPDGRWFACALTPNEGDSDIIVRETKGDKIYTFPAGELSRGTIVFSEDGKWLAFTIAPKRNEAKKLKKQKKPLTNSAGLVDLSTGEKVEFEKVKSFAFSGENPGWIALHKDAGESGEKDKDGPKGADLILRELATGQELNIGNVSEFAFNKSGTFLAWLIDAQDQSGNSIGLRDMANGVVQSLDSDNAWYAKLTWTEKGDGLAALKGKEDKAFEDKLYCVLGFTDFKSGGNPLKTAYDPKEDKTFPEGMTVSPNRNPRWTEDFGGILFGIHDVKKKEPGKEDEGKKGNTCSGEEKKKSEKVEKKDDVDDEDIPDMVIWHWKDKRLQSMQQVQEKRDKEFSYLSVYRVKEKAFIRLADDEVERVEPAPKDRYAIGYADQAYRLAGNLDGRRYQDIYILDLRTGERKLALKKNRWSYDTSPSGAHLLYYEDGHYHTLDLATGASVNITQNVPVSFINEEDDHNVVNPPIRPVGWVSDGKSVLLSDNWDIWRVPVTGGKGTNLTLDGKTESIRYQRHIKLDPEEKGISLDGSAYFTAYGEWTKKGGIIRIDRGKPTSRKLLWDDAAFSKLLKAKKAGVFVYTRETFEAYPDFYVTDADLKNSTRITNANPQQTDVLWSSGVRLVDYTSNNGDKLQGALYLPATYEEGKRYPAVVYMYEKLSQNLNRYAVPDIRRFNKSYYNSHGYAVLMPDIVFKVNDPGKASVACIVPAVEKAVEMGIVDRDRIGIHGHSWGGYQTAFIITQTNLFKAAIAGAPLTNMISMYSSIYWNSGSANQSIFESSQGRFIGGYWEVMDAYERNSPVYFADKVTTPLILLHNDKDGAVDWNQGIEYFNTLRRLKKPVVMLQYKGENHGLRKPENMKDYMLRQKEFFDHYLMDKPAPEWWTEGVSHLDHKDALKERVKTVIQGGGKGE